MDSKTCNSPMCSKFKGEVIKWDFKRNSGNRINSFIMKTKTIFLMDSDLVSLLAGLLTKTIRP